jgi:hypothetical protein
VQCFLDSAILLWNDDEGAITVFTEEFISLDCPYCKIAISLPLSWFKQTYMSCPACHGGLAAGQFAPLVEDLEQAMDASVDEMVRGATSSGCARGGCGDGSCSH